MTTTAAELHAKLVADVTRQAEGCALTGSYLYASLLRDVAADVAAEGLCWEVLRAHADVPFEHALVLRFLGAVHRVALRGDAPALAAHYPSCGGSPGEGLFADFLDALRAHRDDVIAGLDDPMQTNEVVRSAALYEAFGFVQRRTGLPLSLRELGCSGGLNLGLAWYRYADGDRIGGDPQGKVRIPDGWRGPVRPVFTPLEIVDRAGCDPNPLDPATERGRLQLLGFLWPDQVQRAERTAAAIALAAQRPATIARSNGDVWVAQQLRDRASGTVTVIYHSIVWQYIDREERARIRDAITAAGALASAANPIAWVSFEPAHKAEEALSHAQTTVRLFDGSTAGGVTTVLARHGYHGEWVELLAP